MKIYFRVKIWDIDDLKK